MGFNTVQVNKFFQHLTELYRKYKFSPSAIFNMDESGLSTAPNKVPKVVTTKGKKVVGKERGESITVVCHECEWFPRSSCCSVCSQEDERGTFNWSSSTKNRCVLESGYITSARFVDWIHHFQEKVRADTEHPVLLLLDKHSGHLSLEAIKFCREHNIHLITLPPQSSHRIQLLDKYFFKLLKLCLCS
jgi:hypothetical protein